MRLFSYSENILHLYSLGLGMQMLASMKQIFQLPQSFSSLKTKKRFKIKLIWLKFVVFYILIIRDIFN